jgi:nicotinamidase-related amidase
MIRIAAQPRPFTCEPARTALIAIDFQRDFMEPGGFGAALGNDVSLLAPCVAVAAELFALCRQHGIAIIHTREGHAGDLGDCPPAKREHAPPGLAIGDPGPMGRILVRGEPGHGIIPACAPRPGEAIIDKPGKGAFYATDLEHRLRAAGITHVIGCGVTTEVCVQTTMREAADRGFRCLVVGDATASYFPAFKTSALAMMAAQGGIVAAVTDLAAVRAGVQAAS